MPNNESIEHPQLSRCLCCNFTCHFWLCGIIILNDGIWILNIFKVYSSSYVCCRLNTYMLNAHTNRIIDSRNNTPRLRSLRFVHIINEWTTTTTKQNSWWVTQNERYSRSCIHHDRKLFDRLKINRNVLHSGMQNV